MTSDPVAVPGRVRFAATTLDSDEATLNSTPFKRHTSSTASETVDALYCPGDYDNTTDDDDVRELRQRPSASSTQTAIKPSEEESLDNLLAHLLGEVTSPTSAVQGLSDTCDGQPTLSDRGGAGSSLHWPQGDSLPRVEMRRKVLHDVPVTSGEKLVSDENDNVVKHDVTLQDVIADLTTLQVNTPPLLTVRKKATFSDDVAITSDRGTPAKFNMTPGAGKDEQRNHSLSNGSAEVTLHLNSTAQQLSHTESAQKTALMDEFKALRLQVLTATSQLLSCVSGTWKRGESFRSKLTAIMQLCLELRTSVGKLETFLQSALSTAAANSTLVDTANTRVKNLQAVQTSIDAYIETLDVENLSAGTADKQDLKVGGIIHLTKEIPGLVRTFAPVIEHLAATNDEPDSVAEPHQSDTVSDRQHSSDKNRDSETQSKKVLEEKVLDQDEVKQTSREHSASVCVVAPQTLNERDRSSVEQVSITTTSTNIDNKPAMFPSLQTNQDQPSQPKIPETTPTIVDTDFTTVFSQMSQNKNTKNVSGDDRKDVNRGDDSERSSQQTALPVLRAEVETVSPPTPPPKLRVASLYHANLGISNSLTSAATTTETTATTTTTTTTTTTGRYGEDAVVMTYNLQATKSPSEDHGDIVTVSDDKFQPTSRRADDDSSEVLAVIDYVSGCGDDVVAATDRRYFKFPRATDATTVSEQSAVVLRKHPASVDQSTQHCGRVSESELETPEFRASGVSQTTVDQLEALQRQASAQAVVTHTDSTAGYDRFDPRSPNPQYQSTLTAEDRRLLMFYCDQMTGHWNVLDDAASAFFHCMDRRQPPKVFVSHSKFVIVAGHKMAYLGDVLARNIDDDNAQNWIVAHSNRLCNSLKTAVRSTKEAALAYPSVREQQLMVDCIKEVTDWAIELKEVVDRLAYIGRPDHVLI